MSKLHADNRNRQDFSIDEIIVSTNSKKQSSGQYLGHCPAHDDKNPSFTIKLNNGNPLFHCFSGCTQNEIFNALKAKGFVTSVPCNSNVSIPTKSNQDKSIIKQHFKTRGIVDLDDKFFDKYFSIRKVGSEYSIFYTLSDWDSLKETGFHEIFVNKDGLNIKESDGSSKNKKRSHGKLLNNFPYFGKLEEETLHVAEGLETALSIYSTLGETTMASLGVSNLENINFPETCKTLHVWSDNDTNQIGQKAAQNLCEKEKHNRKTFLHIPISDNNKSVDWLDVFNKNKSSIKESFEKQPLYGWNELKKIDLTLPNTLELRKEIIPGLIHDFISDESNRNGVPIEFYFAPLIVALSAQISRVFKIQMKKNDPMYFEPPLLWGSIIGQPGTMKSHSLKSGGVGFLKNVDKQLLEIENKSIAETKAKQSIIEKKIKEAEGKANIFELAQLKLEQEGLKPQLQKILLNDTTPENLIFRLSNTNKNILLYRDELMGIIADFNSDKKTNLRSLLLEGWNGLDSYDKETLSRGADYIELLSCSLLGGIQPSKILPLLNEILDGKNDDGFLQRFQVMVFPKFDKPNRLDIEPNFQLKKEIENLFQNLHQKELRSNGQLSIIKFSEGANDVYQEFRDKLDNKLYESDLNPTLQSFLSKYPRLFASLALIYEIVECRDRINTLTLISESSARIAMETCDVLQSHLEKLLFFNLNPERNTSVIIIEKFLNGDIKNGEPIRDIYKRNWKGFNRNLTYESIRSLETYGWAKIEKVYPDKGRPSEKVYFHPSINKYTYKSYISRDIR